MRAGILFATVTLSLFVANCGSSRCPGLEDCGGFCADTDIDHENCGACGHICAADEACVGGACLLDCENECDMLRIVRCADPPAEALQVCTPGADGCLLWGAPLPCDEGETCVDGSCEGGVCSDDCETEGERRCEGEGYVLCRDHDGDGCREWGGMQLCGFEQTCSNGACIDGCTPDDCTAGERHCRHDAVWRCAADLDADPCLDWLPVEDCGDDGRCDDGECVECNGNFERCDDEDDCCSDCRCVGGYCGCI